jgi:RNase H-fold protein (predicted Holliday junction resolvase)
VRILAIDPGRDKTGVVAADDSAILDRAVIPTANLVCVLREWGRRYAISQVVLGDRTGRREVHEHVVAQMPGIPVAIVHEAKTTLLARDRYFAEHPPRGWRRLLPPTMQVPPEPYDDYAAVILLERFLEGRDKLDKTWA